MRRQKELKRNILQLSRETIAHLNQYTMETLCGGAPFSKRNKNCETLVPLCVETLYTECTGVPCII